MNTDAAAERWRRVQAVLDAALAQPADAREAAIAAACRDDIGLRDEALALLRHADVLPERVPDAALAGWLDDDATDPRHWIGRELGAFVLEECIGRGGSSLVFRARRRDEFAQRVAIKLLHGIGAPARRFLRERDVLADLRHPNIARLYDAGTTPEGMPYLVLEYIEGQRWDLALAARRPSLRQRLGDVAQVCDAVAYAHQHLCVHRDIKPANLMIDADGTPRLLDFGVAKLLDAGADADNELTRDLGTPLTPAYAAPEQIRGEAATTATDIYALGVLLYETLTGLNPFQRAGASTGDVLRAVAEGEVPRPSICLAQRLAADSNEADGTVPPPIRPAALRGDLDNIVASAMAKDAAQRYASARHLGDDLRAWLDGRPVLARAPTWRYLAGKFARRHRTGVALAALALIVLIGAAVWQAREAQRARDLAEERLVAMRGFVTTVLFDYHEGIQRLEGSLPLQQRMVQDALRYLETLRRDAGDDATLWMDLAAGYLKIGDLQGNPYVANLGDFSGAKASYALSAQALERAVARASETGATRWTAARLSARRAHLLHQETQLEAAAQSYREAIAGYDALVDETDLDLLLEHATTLDFYGDLLGRDGATSLSDRAGAQAAYARALALRESALQEHPDDPQLQLALYNSRMREGELLLTENDPVAAEAVMQRALMTISALRQAAPDDGYRKRELSYTYTRLVAVQDAQGKLDASIESALHAYTLMRQLLERDPGNEAMRQGLTSTAGWAARQLGLAGRHAEAAPIVAQQIEVAKQRLESAPENPEQRFSLVLAYRRLGLVKSGLGEFPQALAAHEEAERLQRDLVDLAPNFAAGHALTMAHIGRAELALQRAAAARTHLSGAAQTLATLHAAHPDVSSYPEDQADALEALGDAWRVGVPDCARTAAAWQQALDVWDAMAKNGTLSTPTAARRDALIARHAALRCQG